MGIENKNSNKPRFKSTSFKIGVSFFIYLGLDSTGYFGHMVRGSRETDSEPRFSFPLEFMLIK